MVVTITSEIQEMAIIQVDRLTKGADGATLSAVSYTHLRAHETVLDLVCRLLLEKINKHSCSGYVNVITNHRDTTNE